MRYSITLVVILAMATVGSAAMTGGFTENVTGTAAGFGVVNDLVVNTTVDWTSGILKVDTDGTNSIYQDPSGGMTSPSNILIGFIPTLEWDTYVTGGTFSTAAVTGELVSFTTPPAPVMTTDDVDVTWFTLPTNDTGTLELARVIIDSEFTGGSFRLDLYNADSASIPAMSISGTIVNGHIPEPATMLVMLAGGLALLRRRK